MFFRVGVVNGSNLFSKLGSGLLNRPIVLLPPMLGIELADLLERPLIVDLETTCIYFLLIFNFLIVRQSNVVDVLCWFEGDSLDHFLQG